MASSDVTSSDVAARWREGGSGSGLEVRLNDGERLLCLEGIPQQGAQPGGVDAFEQIGNDNAVDHVGQHGHP